jgi:hypothetical protein
LAAVAAGLPNQGLRIRGLNLFADLLAVTVSVKGFLEVGRDFRLHRARDRV